MSHKLALIIPAALACLYPAMAQPSEPDSMADYTAKISASASSQKSPSGNGAEGKTEDQPASKPAADDSLGDSVRVPSESSPSRTATGLSMVPGRIEQSAISFAATTAAEAVLRLSSEFGFSFVLVGDPNSRVVGQVIRQDGPEAAAKTLFGTNGWSVKKSGRSIVISQTPPFTFPRIKFAELDRSSSPQTASTAP